MVHQQVGAVSGIDDGAASRPSRGTRDSGVRKRRKEKEEKVSHTVITLATLNISDSRASELWSAARAMRLGKIDITVVQESKFTNANFAMKKRRDIPS